MAKVIKREQYIPIRFPNDEIDLTNIIISMSKISSRFVLHCKDDIDNVTIYLNKSNTEELLKLLDWYIKYREKENG